MIASSFFQIGSQHIVCEDFALSGENFAVLSDGCSNAGGGSISSDWGARILCKATELYISELAVVFDKREEDSKSISNAMLEMLLLAVQQARAFPNLAQECLTATLLALIPGQKAMHGLVYGDGIIGGYGKNGWTIAVIEYPPGGIKGQSGCYYPIYELGNKRELYLEQFGGIQKVTIHEGPSLDALTSRTAEHNLRRVGVPWFQCEFDFSQYEFAFIASDGIHTFMKTVKTDTSKHVDGVNFLLPLKEILDIPGFNPGFMIRQQKWLSAPDRGVYAKQNWQHGDDLSVGVVHFHS